MSENVPVIAWNMDKLTCNYPASVWLTDNYLCKENSITDVWWGLKHSSDKWKVVIIAKLGNA